MTSPFDKTETWIETGPDGLHYYVRKKQPPKLPSFKAIFREAIHDLWHGPSPYWKELKRASKNRRPSAPATTPASQVFSNPFPHSISHISLQPPAMPSSEESSNSMQPRGILKPEPPRFPPGPNGGPPLSGWPPTSHAPAHPFPAMNPNIQQSYAGYPPQAGYNAMQVHNPMQTYLSSLNLPPGPPQTYHSHLNLPPGPTQPPGGFRAPALPPGARAISPPRYPSQDDLKYKCAVCGRFRSARYHYTHPLAPGQLPGTTICRRCRNTATDSEDESTDSETSLDENTRGRRGSGRRSRALSSRPRSRRSLSRRGRSRSQAAWSDDENYFDDERSRRRRHSISMSRSFDDIRPSRSGSVIMQRRRSPSVEEVEYVRRPRSRQVRRVVYVEDEEPEYLSSYDAGDVEVRTIRRAPRAPTPSHRRIRRQYSDPGLGSTYPSDRVVDFEERGSRYTTPTPRVPPSFSRQGAYQTESSDVEYDWYGSDPYHRPGRSGSRRRGGYEYRRDAGHVRPGPSGHPISVPSPDSEVNQRAIIYKGEDARSTPSSRSMERTSPELGHRPYLRQVDQQSNSDDYDWYDKDGMRVRVREI